MKMHKPLAPRVTCLLSCFSVKDKVTPAIRGSGRGPPCQGYTGFLAVEQADLISRMLLDRCLRRVSGQSHEDFLLWRMQEVNKNVFLKKKCFQESDLTLIWNIFIGLFMHRLIQFSSVKNKDKFCKYSHLTPHSGACFEFIWIWGATLFKIQLKSNTCRSLPLIHTYTYQSYHVHFTCLWTDFHFREVEEMVRRHLWAWRHQGRYFKQKQCLFLTLTEGFCAWT